MSFLSRQKPPLKRPNRSSIRKNTSAIPTKITPNKKEVKHRLAEYKEDKRFQHELKEMQETQDLDEIDDDVEDVATLYEWYAIEHNHQPKSSIWFIVLAVGTTLAVAFFIIMANVIGAITVTFVGALVYYIAQKDPAMARYRIMVDGVALNNTLYHFKDLEVFNIIYEPDQTKTVILRSKRTFAPLLHMEIGDADPVEIRDVLLEFIEEDQDLEEPLVDIIARRLKF